MDKLEKWLVDGDKPVTITLSHRDLYNIGNALNFPDRYQVDKGAYGRFLKQLKRFRIEPDEPVRVERGDGVTEILFPRR